MAIPNPNPNIADGIKSDNKTYSSNKIESLIKTATELPIPEAGDAGKVLTVNAGETGYELTSVLKSDNQTGTTSTYGNVSSAGLLVSDGVPVFGALTSSEGIITFYLDSTGTKYIPHITDAKGDILANTQVEFTIYYI